MHLDAPYDNMVFARKGSRLHRLFGDVFWWSHRQKGHDNVQKKQPPPGSPLPQTIKSSSGPLEVIRDVLLQWFIPQGGPRLPQQGGAETKHKPFSKPGFAETAIRSTS